MLISVVQEDTMQQWGNNLQQEEATMIKEEVVVDLEEMTLEAEADGTMEEAMMATVPTTGTIPTSKITLITNRIHHKQQSSILPKILNAEQKN